jgi:hypothetical protein
MGWPETQDALFVYGLIWLNLLKKDKYGLVCQLFHAAEMSFERHVDM